MHFYILDCDYNDGPKDVNWTIKHVRCSQCGLRPVARVGSLRVRYSRKRELVDWARVPGATIVHQRVIDDLTAHKISGWRAGILGIESTPRLANDDLNYSELVIIGHTRGYTARIGLGIARECDECGRRIYRYPQVGLEMPLECWDGSDIFQIDELPGFQVVTEPVKELIETSAYTGVLCVPIAEWRDPLSKSLLEWMEDI